MLKLRNAPSWLRGAGLLAVLVLFAAGCSNDGEFAQSDTMFSPVDAPMSLGVVPDFCPNLPDYPIVVLHRQPGPESLFTIWFWGILGDGYDIATGDILPGWCVEDAPLPNVQDPGRVTMYCSYDDALPGNLSEFPINELNYLLNHKIGTPDEIQAAIWLLLGYDEPSKPATENSYAMLEDAQANGGDFIPGPGDIVFVFLYTGDGGIAPEGFQETIIELRIPGDETGGDACTPGYWKTHFDRWPDAYDPFDDFDATFGTDYFGGEMTLGDATWLGGGGVKKLARHGVAALMNAAHGGVEYPYAVEEVIQMVRDGEADMLADTNDDLDCPLGGSPANPKVKARGRK